MERRYFVNPDLAWRFAECDGGVPVMTEGGVTAALRGLFRGRLSGVFYEQGDPPWRWYELTELSIKPDWHPHRSVWCEEGFLFIDEVAGYPGPAPARPETNESSTNRGHHG